jgi:hypothetical protein
MTKISFIYKRLQWNLMSDESAFASTFITEIILAHDLAFNDSSALHLPI